MESIGYTAHERTENTDDYTREHSEANDLNDTEILQESKNESDFVKQNHPSDNKDWSNEDHNGLIQKTKSEDQALSVLFFFFFSPLCYPLKLIYLLFFSLSPLYFFIIYTGYYFGHSILFLQT